MGELTDGVGGEAEQRRHLGRALTLDLGVPEHQLPALGQRGERPRRGIGLEACDCGVVERQARVEPAYGGQHVGPEGQVRAVAAGQDGQHLREHLGDQVVRVALGREDAGQPARGIHVPLEQHAVGVRVAVADRSDEGRVVPLVEHARGGRHAMTTVQPAKDHVTVWTSGQLPTLAGVGWLER